MLKSGGWIEFAVAESEPKLLQDALRSNIRGMMASKERVCVEFFKRKFDDPICGFRSQSLSPALRAKMETNLEYLLFRPIRA